jgi:hypothetical protein
MSHLVNSSKRLIKINKNLRDQNIKNLNIVKNKNNILIK